ncbi:hypothetical protein AVEN_37718-1 [Araneus ventricosus]|uniref:Uncharacterized protein n=1 Tax=Araneus ventricosus TaxID=182803 RepID=A0A4Y2BVE9_ARAVE|nr:hypothetical protein AVEN_37718-1 [Araneus ventricosus]
MDGPLVKSVEGVTSSFSGTFTTRPLHFFFCWNTACQTPSSMRKPDDNFRKQKESLEIQRRWITESENHRCGGTRKGREMWEGISLRNRGPFPWATAERGRDLVLKVGVGVGWGLVLKAGRRSRG